MSGYAMQWGKNLTALWLGYQKWQVLDAARYTQEERDRVERIYLSMKGALSDVGWEAVNRAIDMDSHYVNDYGMQHTLPPDQD